MGTARLKELQKKFAVVGDTRILEEKEAPSAFFVMQPSTDYRHAFLVDYIIASEAVYLWRAGFKVNVLILDRSVTLSDKSITSEQTQELIRSFLILCDMINGSRCDINFILESSAIDEHTMVSNILALLSSFSADEGNQLMEKRISFGFNNGFFDIAGLLSLPASLTVDVVVTAHHEKVAQYLVRKKMSILSNGTCSPVLCIASPVYYLEKNVIEPYGGAKERISLLDEDGVICKKVFSMKPRDVRTVTDVFLNEYLQEGLAEKYMSAKMFAKFRQFRETKKGNSNMIFFDFLTRFLAEFRTKFYKAENIGSIGFDDPASLGYFSALSSDCRLRILKLLKEPMRAVDLMNAMQEDKSMENLTLAHMHYHLQKLLELGLIGRKENRYYRTFKDMKLSFS